MRISGSLYSPVTLPLPLSALTSTSPRPPLSHLHSQPQSQPQHNHGQYIFITPFSYLPFHRLVFHALPPLKPHDKLLSSVYPISPSPAAHLRQRARQASFVTLFFYVMDGLPAWMMLLWLSHVEVSDGVVLSMCWKGQGRRGRRGRSVKGLEEGAQEGTIRGEEWGRRGEVSQLNSLDNTTSLNRLSPR